MSAKTNLILDSAIFAAFLAVSNPVLTGITVHEWLALAFAVAVIVHLLFHWDWLVKVTRQFFQKLFHQSRLNYVIDALFFIALTATMISGLMISKIILPTLGIALSVSRSWRMVHSFSADASLILLGLHFALHFKWVVYQAKRYLVSPIIRRFKHPVPDTLAVQPVRIDESR